MWCRGWGRAWVAATSNPASTGSRKPQPRARVSATSTLYWLLPRNRDLTHVNQAPLFEHTVDTELQGSTRNHCLPTRFWDYLLTLVVPTHLSRQYATWEKQSKASLRAKEVVTQPPPLSDPKLDDNPVGDQMGSKNIITNANSFRVFQKYFTISSHSLCNPDAFADVPMATATSRPQSIGSGLTAVAPAGEHNPLTNSHNWSEDLLVWMTLGSGNTPAEMNELVHNVIIHPEFNLSELHNFNAVTATRCFDHEHFSKSGPTLKAGDGWKEGLVRIRVPCTREKQKEDDAPEFVVDGILYQDVVKVITTELEDLDAFNNIHTTPYEEWWYPHPGRDPVCIYSETYNSDAMLQANKEMWDNLRAIPRPGDDLETFIVSALLYSSSTHLASFGNASLWPMYLYLGNVSKYICSKPTSFSAHHITYIPTVCCYLPLTQSYTSSNYASIAPRLHQGVLPGTLWSWPQCRHAHAPGAGVDSCSVMVNFRWFICRCS